MERHSRQNVCPRTCQNGLGKEDIAMYVRPSFRTAISYGTRCCCRYTRSLALVIFRMQILCNNFTRVPAHQHAFPHLIFLSLSRFHSIIRTSFPTNVVEVPAITSYHIYTSINVGELKFRATLIFCIRNENKLSTIS